MNSIKASSSFIDLSTRGKRRKAVAAIIEILEKIRAAEETNLERFPLNFRDGDAYAAADYSLDVIIDAICGLIDAYE